MIKLLRKFGFFPRVAVWELTLRCNLNCRHCGSKAGKPRDDELTLPEVIKLANDLADMHCQQVTLSGGEPTLRKDWPLIAQTLVDRGVTVGMITNGMGWTEDRAKTAKAIGLESVAFSLDGFQESHEYLRGVKGQWQKVVDAVKACNRIGLTASIVTTVTRQNLPDLEKFREFLAEIGVQRWQVQMGTPTGNMADNLDLVCPPETMLTMVPLIARWRKDKKRPFVYPGHDIGYFGEHEEALRDPNSTIPYWVGCTAGCSTIGIESNGNIKGCLSLPSSAENEGAFVEGNVRETSLREIWRRKGAFAYNREFTVDLLGGFCRTCEYAEICRGGCTWTTYAERGLVRDNPYCYFRQLSLKEAKEAEPKKDDRVPIGK